VKNKYVKLKMEDNMENFRKVLTFVILSATVTFAATYSGGSGTSGDPYLIATPVDMNTIGLDANDWNKCFKLIADINMAAYTYSKPLISPDTNYANSGCQGTAFTGVFDGNNHSITSLKIQTAVTNASYIGLFGQIGTAGVVRNLNIEDVNVNGGLYADIVGGLCGYNYGSVTNCHTAGSVRGDVWIAGLCGSNNGNLTNCSSSAAVSGTQNVGGLCGSTNSGTISNCSTTGRINGTGTNTGGLCGSNGSRIEYSYSASDVNGVSSVGGLCGYTSIGVISTSYATGNVTGSNNYTGGLCGYIYSGNINKCYSTGIINGKSNTGGLCGLNNGNITSSYAIGHVIGKNLFTGGLCGWNEASGQITNCYSEAEVDGYRYTGGLCGADSYKLTNCYSIGDVNATGTNIGGFCGYKYSSGVITNCYFLDIAGPSNGYGTAFTDAQMKQQANFASWDFTSPVWRICESLNYPQLSWQIIMLGDFVCPDGVNFLDFAVLADAWQSVHTDDDWNEDCDISTPNDNKIDFKDFAVFAGNWLE
jgi:hypothetical protein